MMAYSVADIPNYSQCEQLVWDGFTPEVRRWKGIVNLYMPFQLVMKFLYTIKYESGGNAYALGDNGVAIGLLQIQDKRVFPDRPTKEELLIPHVNVNYAASVLGARNNRFQPWGEGALYQGKPFGALGNHPYPCTTGGLNPIPSFPTPAQIADAYPDLNYLRDAVERCLKVDSLRVQGIALGIELAKRQQPSPQPTPQPTPRPAPVPGDGGLIDIDIGDFDWIKDPFGFIDKLLGFIDDVAGFIEENLNIDVGNLVDAIGGKVDGIKDAITKKIDGVGKSIGGALKTIGNGLDTGIQTVLENVSEIANVVETGLRFSATTISGAVDRIYDGIEATLIPALDTISELIETAVDGTVGGAIGLANDAIDALEGATSSAIGVIDDVVDGFVDVVDSLANGVVEGIQGAISGVTAGVESIAGFLGDTLPELLRGLGDNIADVGAGIVELPVNLATALVTGLFGIARDITDEFDDLSRHIPRAEFERLI